MSLPLAAKRPRSWHVVGVLTGSHNLFVQCWSILTGKSRRVTAYLVNAKVAVDCLAAINPEAAKWWREHTPILLSGRHYFTFNAEACEPE